MAGRLWLVIGAVLACTLVPGAVAQTGAGVGYSRPADRGPSSRIGLVGGRYTADSVAGPAAPVSVAGPNRALGLPSRSRWGSRYAPAPLRLGPMGSTYRGTLLPTPGAISGWQMQSMSGYAWSVRMDTPLYGWGPTNMLRISTTPLRRPMPQGSAFHRAMGLKPTKDEPPAGEPVENDTLWKTVERGTNDRVALRMEEAQSILREVTTGELLEPAEYVDKLDRAMRLFRYVRKLDKTDYVPCLLEAHVAIERGQLSTAMNSLVAAARRDGEAFRDGPSPATYFGDYDEETGRSVRFEAHMRAMLRTIGEGLGPDDVVLEAYCAWGLGDNRRAGQTLDRAEDLLKKGTSGTPDLELLVNALRYAL